MNVVVPTPELRQRERVRPAGRAVMRQEWAHLLFLHWAIEPAIVQATLPAGLTVDTYDGKAWVGLVPFFMRQVRPTGLPAVPGLSNFLELNVRTYVHDARGRPGVWFYSLDCNQWAAVKIARQFFHLPYEHAVMGATIDPATGEVAYRSRRAGRKEESRFRYRTMGAGREAQPGSLDFFLLERYTLFAHDSRRGRLWAGQVAHTPYRMQRVDVGEWQADLVQRAGFHLGRRAPDHISAAETVDVEIFPLAALR